MELGKVLLDLTSKLDRELEELGNVLAVPFLYDLYLPYYKKFVDLRSDVIREFFVHYSTYPLVFLGTPLVRGIRTTSDLDLSGRALHVDTLKGRGKRRGTNLWGSFVTWANVKPLPKDTGRLTELLPLLWYMAVLRAKPLGIPNESGKYFNYLAPNPLSLFTILGRDDSFLVLSPFSAMMVLSVGEDSQWAPYFPEPFHVLKATAYTFVTDGKRVRFAGPFRAFVPDIEGINIGVEPGEAVLDYYLGFAVFPAQGSGHVSMGLVNSIYRNRPFYGYFLVLGRIPLSLELYYTLNFGKSADRKVKSVEFEKFKRWRSSLADAISVLSGKLDFEEAWGLAAISKLYGNVVKREGEKLTVPEAHLILKALAWDINPFEEPLIPKSEELLFEVPNPSILGRISDDADRGIRSLLNSGLGILV